MKESNFRLESLAGTVTVGMDEKPRIISTGKVESKHYNTRCYCDLYDDRKGDLHEDLF